MSWTPPPNWPAPPHDGWSPPPGWQPDARWGPPPPGWNFWPQATPQPYGSMTIPPAGPYQSPGFKTWVVQHKVAAGVIGVILAVVVVGGIGDAVNSGGSPAKASPPAATSNPFPGNSQPFTPGPVADPPATPDPSVKYTSSCDYILGNFTDSAQGYRFIARATLHNKGNVGTKVTVHTSWVQVGAANIKRTKTVRVPYGATKAVNFTVVVGQNQIDEIQAGQDAGDICHVGSKMVGTFGHAH